MSPSRSRSSSPDLSTYMTPAMTRPGLIVLELARVHVVGRRQASQVGVWLAARKVLLASGEILERSCPV